MAVQSNDIAKTTIQVDGKQGINQLGLFEAEAAKAAKQMQVLERATKEYTKTSDKMKSLEAAGKKQSKAYENAAKKLKELEGAQQDYLKATDKYKDAERKVKGLREQLGLAGLTMRQLKNRQRELNREMENTTRGTTRYKELNTEMDKVKAEMASTNNTTKKSTNIFSSFGGELMQLGGKGGAIAAVAAGLLYLGNQILSVEKKFTGLMRTTKRVTGETGEVLEQTTARIQSLSDVYGEEYNEILKATQSVATAYKIDFREALDLVEKGFLNGANASGDYVSQLKEYAVQAKNARISAEDFIKVLVQQEGAALFDDKLIDTIKELGLRLNEFTPTVEKALKPLGKEFSNEVKQSIESGEDVVDIFQKIFVQSKRSGLSVQELQTIIADLGGGALEDVGGLEVAYENLNEAIGRNLDKLDELGEKQKEELEIQQDLNKELARLSTNFSGFGDFLKNTFSVILSTTVGLFNDWLESMQSVDTVMARNKDTIKSLNYDEVIDGISTTTDELAKLRKEQERVQEIYDNTSTSSNYYNTASANLLEALNQVEIYEQKLKDLEERKAELKKQSDQEWSDARDRQIEEEKRKKGKGKGNDDDKKKKKEKPVDEFGPILDAWRALRREVGEIEQELEASQLTTDEQVIAGVQARFDTLKAKTLEFYNSQLIDQKEFNAERERIDLAAEEAIKQKKEEVGADFVSRGEALATEQDLELVQIASHYDALIAEAQRLGLEENTIRELTAQKNKAIEDKELQDRIKRAQATQAVLGGLSDFAGALAQAAGDDSEAMAEFQKLATLFQIGLDTAAAISSLTAASEANPSNSVTFGGAGAAQFIAGLVRITTNVAKARQVLSKEKKPKSPNVGRSTSKTGITEGTSYFFGGATGKGNIGTGDRYGAFAGYVHQDEYVIPASVRRDPVVADFESIIESKRTGQSTSSQLDQLASKLNSPQVITQENAATLEVLTTIAATLKDNAERPTMIQWGYRDTTYVREEIDDQIAIEDLAKI
ncbi:phage tail tape measure protein [Limibacter armeniacum]|uniref:phage tail tape measure protein n=1 Tax=Limibacter armeniacum TaxID=466084 RepID=UPI002FE62A04